MTGTVQQHADACICSVSEFVDWVVEQYKSVGRGGYIRKPQRLWVTTHTPQESAQLYFQTRPDKALRLASKRMQPLKFIGNPEFMSV